MRYRVTIDLVDDNGVVVQSCTQSTNVVDEHDSPPSDDIGSAIFLALEGIGLPRSDVVLCHAIDSMSGWSSIGGLSDVLDESRGELYRSSQFLIEAWEAYDKANEVPA